MTALTTIAFNGTPIEDPTIGLELDTVDGLHAITKRVRPTVVMPLVPGQRSLSVGSSVEPRTAPLRFAVRPSSFTNRQTKLDALDAYLNTDISVTRVDSPDRVLTCRLEEMPVSAPWRIFAGDPAVYADFRLVADDPYFYDATAVTQTILAGVDGAITMGSSRLLNRLVYKIHPCTNPVVILKDQGGTEVQRMTFTGTIPAGQTLDVDCQPGPGHYTIIQNAAGTNRLSWLGATETFFVLRLGNGITGFTLSCAQADLDLIFYRSYDN